MLGWQLFMWAATLLTDNLGPALRVSLVPYALFSLAILFLGDPVANLQLPAPGDPTAEGSGAPEGGGAQAIQGNLLAAMGGVLLYLLVTLWVAVAWHRFALLDEEPPGWVPPLQGKRMMDYLLSSIVVTLFALAAFLLTNTVLATLLVPLVGTGGGLTAVFAMASFLVGMTVFYRLAAVLPARAIDRPLSYGDAMRATAGHTQTMVALALLTAGLSFLLQIPVAVEGSVGLVTTVYELVVGWIGLMLGAGVLTTLYGHLVEGRPV